MMVNYKFDPLINVALKFTHDATSTQNSPGNNQALSGLGHSSKSQTVDFIYLTHGYICVSGFVFRKPTLNNTFAPKCFLTIYLPLKYKTFLFETIYFLHIHIYRFNYSFKHSP